MKKLIYSTGFCVNLYFIFYMSSIFINCLPRLLSQININYAIILNNKFSLPLEIFDWGFLAICSIYSGLDRGVFIKKTTMMEIGKGDMGDPSKIRKIIFLLFGVFMESMLLNLFFGSDVVTEYGTFYGANIPLDGIASAIVSTVVIYVGGNKGIRFAQNFDKTKEDEPWSNEREESLIIKNKDNL